MFLIIQFFLYNFRNRKKVFISPWVKISRNRKKVIHTKIFKAVRHGLKYHGPEKKNIFAHHEKRNPFFRKADQNPGVGIILYNVVKNCTKMTPNIPRNKQMRRMRHIKIRRMCRMFCTQVWRHFGEMFNQVVQ